MKIGISSRKISTSVLISMTDVIFLLLIFLLIASNYSAQTGIPLKLPGSTTQNRQANQVLNVVYISDSDIRFLNGSYSLDTLASVLKKEYKSNTQIVKLSAERSTPLQEVISVMDAIRGAGYERIFIATETQNKEK